MELKSWKLLSTAVGNRKNIISSSSSSSSASSALLTSAGEGSENEGLWDETEVKEYLKYGSKIAHIVTCLHRALKDPSAKAVVCI